MQWTCATLKGDVLLGRQHKMISNDQTIVRANCSLFVDLHTAQGKAREDGESLCTEMRARKAGLWANAKAKAGTGTDVGRTGGGVGQGVRDRGQQQRPTLVT